MAITLYTGVPGSGKSYALVEQQIVPAVAKGRRVLTNVEGVNPRKVRDYVIAELGVEEPGEVVLFEGRDAQEDRFWPTEEIPDTHTTVKGGDLIVFDEWRLFFPKRGKLPCATLEPFLRFHRHLMNAQGVTCDLAIGTQLATDIHMDFRGLVERSFKFRKLKAVGLPKFYSWHVYEGHLQSKDGAYDTGTERYRPEIFALYKSYAGDANGKELAGDKRTSIMGKHLYFAVGAIIAAVGIGVAGVWSFFSSPEEFTGHLPAGQVQPGQPLTGAVPAPAASPSSAFRITGFYRGATGLRVILSDRAGAVRVVGPEGFSFDGERPIAGKYEGQTVRSEDWLEDPQPALLPAQGPMGAMQ